MANPLVGELNEGKDWRNAHAIQGAILYWGLLRGKSWADGSIVDTSSFATLTAAEENGTGYARLPVVMGASVNGIMPLPGAIFLNGANAWHNNIAAAFISPNVSGAQIIDVWDLGGRFGNLVSGSPVITALTVNPVVDLRVGLGVLGVGIPAGATILSIDSTTQITLSANATATATGVALAFSFDMSPQNTRLTIPQVNDFLKNVWE